LRLWKGIDMREGYETYTEMTRIGSFHALITSQD
jgi:hypothetical protein